MTKKGIIYETLGSTAQMRIDESNDSGEVILHGIFGVCGVKNGNNRIYEKANYGKMVDLLKEQIARDEAVLGELEHPNTMNITLENVSHKIEDIKMNEDGTVTGSIRLLDTPKGKIAKAIIQSGCPLYISSRGAGSIDESGRVTLTMLRTYDLVGTPGFSQAKLTLKGNQKFESLNESQQNPCWMIVESEDEEPKQTEEPVDNDETPKEDETKNNGENANEDKIKMEDIKKSIDALTDKVSKLEAELHIAKEAKDAAEKALDESKKTINYAAVQQWIQEEYAPELRKSINETVKANLSEWVNEEYSGHLQNWIYEELAPSIQEWTVNEFGKKVQDWTINEFGQQIQEWLSTEYAGTIQEWTVNEFGEKIQEWLSTEYAGTIQEWLSTEYASTFEKWINEEYTSTLQDWMTEHLIPEQMETINKNVSDFIESRESGNKYSRIDEMLDKLTQSVDANTAAQLLEASQNDKYDMMPVVAGMPANYRPIWEGLSNEKKESIIRESRMYDMTKPNAIAKFWASRPLGAVAITEDLNPTPAPAASASGRDGVFAKMKQLRTC